MLLTQSQLLSVPEDTAVFLRGAPTFTMITKKNNKKTEQDLRSRKTSIDVDVLVLRTFPKKLADPVENPEEEVRTVQGPQACLLSPARGRSPRQTPDVGHTTKPPSCIRHVWEAFPRKGSSPFVAPAGPCATFASRSSPRLGRSLNNPDSRVINFCVIYRPAFVSRNVVVINLGRPWR